MHTLDLSGYSITSSLSCVFAALASHPGRRYWLKDTDGRYLVANDLFSGDLGMSVAELVGRTTDEVWPDCAEEISRIDSLVAATRSDISQHVEGLVLPCGSVLSVEVSRSPVVDSAGELVGVAGYYDCGQSAAHRAAETQLILALVPPDCRARISAGLDALAEEFSS